MSLFPQYRHVINPRLKHIYLTFDERGDIVVKSPKVPLRQIEQLLLKKASWIKNAREKLHRKKGKSLDFSDTPELYFMGNVYTLTLTVHNKKKNTLHFDGELFTLFYHKYDELHFRKLIDNFYKTQAQLYLPLEIERWAKKMTLTPTDIRFRKTKRQWGSCSGKNILSFNTMLMKLPKDVIQYIIVHELAHIKHKHHQKQFWQEVEVYLPDYRSQVLELKNYTT